MKQTAPILFTAAGRHAPLLDAFARALGQRSPLYAADLRSEVPAFKAAGRSFHLPAYTAPNYAECLLDLIRQHRPMMLFPLHDYELLRQAGMRQSIEDLGTRLMLPSDKQIAWCHDKHRMASEWPTDRLPTLRPIPGWIDPLAALAAVEARQLHFPLLLKPRLGSASLLMKRVDRPKDLLSTHQSLCEQLPDDLLRLRYSAQSVADHNETDCWLNRHEAILIQPYLEHVREWGMDVLGDLEGNVLDVWVKQKLEMRHGRTHRALPVCRPSMTSVGLELGEWMRQPGNLDVDLLSDAQGTLWLADVNPRFGGGYRFSDRFGARYPERILKAQPFF